MTDKEDEIANISISLNDKGQFIFDIRGESDDAKRLAFTIISYTREFLNRDPKSRNKFVFVGEDVDLLH